MNVVVVYASQFGNTERVARAIGGALERDHHVRVLEAEDALTWGAQSWDLLLVGAPTQMFGRRHLIRSFLDDLEGRGVKGLAAAAFDTRMGTPTQRNASEAEAIARRLEAAGCRVVAPPASFLVTGFSGPLAEGEEERARRWAMTVAERLTVPAR